MAVNLNKWFLFYWRLLLATGGFGFTFFTGFDFTFITSLLFVLLNVTSKPVLIVKLKSVMNKTMSL